MSNEFSEKKVGLKDYGVFLARPSSGLVEGSRFAFAGVSSFGSRVPFINAKVNTLRGRTSQLQDVEPVA